jgi:topoisomerase IV subunit A
MNDQLDMDLEGAPPKIVPIVESEPPAPEAPRDPSSPRADGPLKRLVDSNFLQYASYVIRDRAIPELADGLKPVQRRILYALHEKDDGKFIKVANIVGYCMQYHPHGDVSITDALVGLANKGYLIEGQGNFGNILTGDRAAASRYIECRLTELARTQLFNDQLTKLVPSYDSRNREPVALPAKLPLLLLLGADGIAVGLATRILPHNFSELLEAQIAILNRQSFAVVPDFPQGGIADVSEYDKGRGRVRVRAAIEKRDAETLVIREIPYGTTTDSVIASIEDAARKKKVRIRTISDFTSEKVEIAVTLAPDEDPDKAIQTLYAFTACEVPLSSNIVVIRNRRPVEMDVEEILRHNTQQLVATLKKELQQERQRLLDEIHAKTLVQIFVENRIYKDIEECRTGPDVNQAVLDGVNCFRDQLRRDVTKDDVEMLLEVRIKRISLFDINRNRKEIDDLVIALGEVEKHLGEIVPYTIRYLKALLKKYGPQYPRRTKLARFEQVEVRELTASELCVRYDRRSGYLGHAVEGEPQFECSSLDKVILVWKDGRYKMLPPPDKMFADADLLYCGRFDRDRVMTAVYTAGEVTYVKRFAFGGTIMNKEYLCTLPGAKLWLFADETPEEIYVKYAPAKGQRIHQQIFRPSEVRIKGVSARGNQMSMKQVVSVGTRKPRGWIDKEAVRGTFM